MLFQLKNFQLNFWKYANYCTFHSLEKTKEKSLTKCIEFFHKISYLKKYLGFEYFILKV